MAANRSLGIFSAERRRSGAWFVYAAALCTFFIPIITKGMQYLIAVMVVAWTFTPKRPFRETWVPVLIFTGIYLFHLVGMLYTEDVTRGLNDLEQKFSLLLFPVLFGTVRIDRLSKEGPAAEPRTLVLATFVAGVFASVFISFSDSMAKYSASGDMLSFYMSEFSPVHHPSYVTMYMNLAGAVLILAVLRKKLRGKFAAAAWAGVFFIAATLVFPASKMGFIQFGFLAAFGLFVAARSGKFISTDSMFILGAFVLFAVVLKTNPVAEGRIAAAVKTVSSDEKPARELETNVARINAWRMATDEILKNPFGTGTGDVHEAMMARYRAEGYHEMADIGLNPHNNYLQIALALGIPALLWFLVSLAWPARMIIRQQDYIYAFFLIGMMMHLFVESMLEKQSGVVFFAFFNAFFYFSAPVHFSVKRENHSELKMP